MAQNNQFGEAQVQAYEVTRESDSEVFVLNTGSFDTETQVFRTVNKTGKITGKVVQEIEDKVTGTIEGTADKDAIEPGDTFLWTRGTTTKRLVVEKRTEIAGSSELRKWSVTLGETGVTYVAP